MNDNRIDQMVRDADPYDAKAIGNLQGAKQELLEEIMSQPPVKHLIPHGKRRVLFASVTLAAAAALTVALAAPALLSHNKNVPTADGPNYSQSVDTNKGQIVYAAAIVKAAEQNPRLLIGEPGWKATHVYGFTKNSGTIEFVNGGRSIEMDWYPANQYDGLFKDRLDISKPEAITVAGQSGDLFRYSTNDFATILKPDGDSFAELRTGSGWNGKAEILATFAKIKKVTVNTWLAALPDSVVKPGPASAVVDEMTSDMSLPPGFDNTKYDNLGTNDRYYFGAAIVDDVVCGWLTTWQTAAKAGNTAAVQRAVDALKAGRHWKVLKEMDTTGEYSMTVRQISDQAAINTDPRRLQESMGCH